MLEDYAKNNGYTNTVHFTDDGLSGGSFERPGWKQMLSRIENGDIGTVIVKDMSRVGRDYLQVGFYTEVFFREKGVRFIAVSNGVDSDNNISSKSPKNISPPSVGWIFPSSRLFFGCANFNKEFIVCEFSPYMIRLQIIEHDPVAVNRFLIQIIYQEVFQEQRILWRICLIAKHSFYFLGRTVVVPLVVPLERPLNISWPIYTGLSLRSARGTSMTMKSISPCRALYTWCSSKILLLIF